MEDKDRHFCTLLQSLDSQEGGSALPSLSWRIFPSTGQGTENPLEKGASPSTNNQSCRWAGVGLLQHRSPWWGCTHLHRLKIQLPRCFVCTTDLRQWDIRALCKGKTPPGYLLAFQRAQVYAAIPQHGWEIVARGWIPIAGRGKLGVSHGQSAQALLQRAASALPFPWPSKGWLDTRDWVLLYHSPASLGKPGTT